MFKISKNTYNHFCHQLKRKLGLFGQFNFSFTTFGMSSGVGTREGCKGKDGLLRAFALLSTIMKRRWMRLHESWWGLFRRNRKIIILLQPIDFWVQLDIHKSELSEPNAPTPSFVGNFNWSAQHTNPRWKSSNAKQLSRRAEGQT